MTLLIDIVGKLGALASLHPAGAMNRAPTHSTSLRSSFFWQFDGSILIMGIADEYIGMLEQDDGTCKQNYRKVPVIQYA
jgi:hypothetical protein